MTDGRVAVDTGYASFLDLIDLLFVKQFLDAGISLQRIRQALDEAESILGDRHFAKRVYFTDGRRIFLKVRSDESAGALLQLLSGGQWSIAPIITEIADQIEFHRGSQLAARWFPPGFEGRIVLDPRISFGEPSIAGRGVPTANVYDIFTAEGERVEAVTSWMQLREADVMSAVGFERQMGAA